MDKSNTYKGFSCDISFFIQRITPDYSKGILLIKNEISLQNLL